MSATIHVDLASIRVADELADYLCSHGLAARVVDDGDECELEVTDPVTPDERLRADVRGRAPLLACDRLCSSDSGRPLRRFVCPPLPRRLITQRS